MIQLSKAMEMNVHQAKKRLSQLIEPKLEGEEVIITKAGPPVVKLVKAQPGSKRTLGSAAGTIRYAEEWDLPMADLEIEKFFGQ